MASKTAEDMKAKVVDRARSVANAAAGLDAHPTCLRLLEHIYRKLTQIQRALIDEILDYE